MARKAAQRAPGRYRLKGTKAWDDKVSDDVAVRSKSEPIDSKRDIWVEDLGWRSWLLGICFAASTIDESRHVEEADLGPYLKAPS